MKMDQEISKIQELENSIQKIIAKIKSEIRSEISDSAMEGITHISKSPRTCVVKLSTLRANNMTMSPEYYIPESQADLVEQKLSSAKTVTEMLKAINDMMSSGYVKIGQNRHKLNPKTIDVLRKYADAAT